MRIEQPSSDEDILCIRVVIWEAPQERLNADHMQALVGQAL